jgi:hypothetical protein
VLDLFFILGHVSAGLQIFKHRHLFKWPPALGAQNQAHFGDFVRRHPLNGMPHEFDLALEGDIALVAAMLGFFPQHQSADGAHGGGFAGAIGPHEADQLTFIDVQADVVDDHRLVITYR